jgi:hypothetical protein
LSSDGLNLPFIKAYLVYFCGMKNLPRLYFLLRNLSKSDHKHFRKYLDSPFCVNRKDLQLLYQSLLPSILNKEDWPTRAAIHQRLFPGQPVNDLRIRGLMSDLHGLVEKFISEAGVLSDTILKQLELVRFYRQKNHPKAFLRTIGKLEQKLDQQAFSRPEDFYYQLQLEEERMKFLSSNKRGGDLRLQEVSNLIDQHFLLLRLRHACTQLTHQRVYNTEYDFGFLPLILDQIETGGYLKFPPIALYYYCYRFLSEEDSLPYFLKFQEELAHHIKGFPREELKDLYLVAINFCIRKMNAFDPAYTEAGFQLYKNALSEGILLENGLISRFTFNNIVGFAIRQKAFEWTARFISAYEGLLEPEFREATVQFNFSRMAYAQKDYQKAAYLLQTSSFKDILNNLIAKTMLLKIFYEQEDWDLLEAQISNFKSYIRRQKLSDYHKVNFKAVIRLIQKLVNLPPGDVAAKETLRKEIEATKILSERRWLLEQLA